MTLLGRLTSLGRMDAECLQRISLVSCIASGPALGSQLLHVDDIYEHPTSLQCHTRERAYYQCLNLLFSSSRERGASWGGHVCVQRLSWRRAMRCVRPNKVKPSAAVCILFLLACHCFGITRVHHIQPSI